MSDWDPDGCKRYVFGRHRVVDPQTTLLEVLKLAPRMGITRLAVLTGLDRVLQMLSAAGIRQVGCVALTRPELAIPVARIVVPGLEGPDLERNGVIRWRCADLRDDIATRRSVRRHERSAGRLLHRLDMTRLQPRPPHPQKDAAAQETFKKIPWLGS